MHGPSSAEQHEPLGAERSPTVSVSLGCPGARPQHRLPAKEPCSRGVGKGRRGLRRFRRRRKGHQAEFEVQQLNPRQRAAPHGHNWQGAPHDQTALSERGAENSGWRTNNGRCRLDNLLGQRMDKNNSNLQSGIYLQ